MKKIISIKNIYNILKLNKELIQMVCAEKNCKIKVYLYISKNRGIGYPDADGNLVLIKTNKSLFTSVIHKILEHLLKSYIKDFINRNFVNIVKNDIFLKEDITHKYLRQYCVNYFLDNPDGSTDKVLNKLSKLFNIVMKINYIHYMII